MEWISVKDRLPEPNRAVLGYEPHFKNIWALTYREDGNWYFWSDAPRLYASGWIGPITHWTYMPDPPEES